MGQYVLDPLALQNSTLWYLVRQPGLIESLPDVAGRTAVDSRIAVTPYIYISQLALLDLQRLLLDGQLVDAPLTKSDAGVLQWTLQALWILWGALDSTKVHHSLIEETRPLPLPVEGGE